MLQIKDTLISLDLFDQYFECDLESCKGACCIAGDSGAPLNDDEILELEEAYQSIKPYMREEGIQAVKQQGLHVIDIENDTVTPLVNKQECAFVIFEDGIAKCAIEKAWLNGDIKFRKPISCHLYPIRLKKLTYYTAVNYDKWEICHAARTKGKQNNTRVYKFTFEALKRRFGSEWAEHLKIAAKELNKDNS